MTSLERIAVKCKAAYDELDRQYELAEKFENDAKKRRKEYKAGDYLPTYKIAPLF